MPGQGNNVYIFPAMGMAVFATEAKRVTEEMFIVAAQAVAEQVTEENLAEGLIYPPQSRILEASLHVAERVAAFIFDQGLARRAAAGRRRRADPRPGLPSGLSGVKGMAEVVDRQASQDVTRADLRPETSPLHPHENSGEDALHRIVVVGGGAAGLELVTRLGDRLGRRSRASVTLVECARTHLWKPLLYEVAAGSIDPGEYELDYLAQAHWHGFRYRFGRDDRARSRQEGGASRRHFRRRRAPDHSANARSVTIRW